MRIPIKLFEVTLFVVALSWNLGQELRLQVLASALETNPFLQWNMLFNDNQALTAGGYYGVTNVYKCLELVL